MKRFTVKISIDEADHIIRANSVSQRLINVLRRARIKHEEAVLREEANRIRLAHKGVEYKPRVW